MTDLYSRDPTAGPVCVIRPNTKPSIIHRPPFDQDGDPVGFLDMTLIVLDNRVYRPLFRFLTSAEGRRDSMIEEEYQRAAEVVVYDEAIDDTFDVLYDPTQPGITYIKYQTVLYVQLHGVDPVTLPRATCVVLREDRDKALRERYRRQQGLDSPGWIIELRSQRD